MPILPNVVGRSPADATAILNASDFNEVTVEGDGPLVESQSASPSGALPNEECPATDVITLKCPST